MKKVLIANVNSELKKEINSGMHSLEFELTELNKHLEDGWEIQNSEIVTPSNNLYSFSIIYTLRK